jgi:hypothetical protein
MRDPREDAKQERRVLAFFAVLGLIIVLTLARGCYNGEIELTWDSKSCRSEDCHVE